MRRPLILLLLALACALPAMQCKKAPVPVTGVVKFVAGAVRISTAGNSAAAKVGDVVREGMTISTSERSFAMVIIGENVIRIYELTDLSFPSLSRNPETGSEKTELRMERGAVLTDVVLKLAKGDSHRITSDTMIAAVRGTEYLYAVDGSSGVVACYRGAMSVLCAGSDEEVILNAGDMLRVREGKAMKPEKIPAGFRYRDFQYGKDPAGGGAAGVSETGEHAAAAAKTPETLTERTQRVKPADTTTASGAAAAPGKQAKRGGTTGSSAAAVSPQKQTQPAGVKPAGTAEDTLRKTAAGKEKPGASSTMTAEQETAAANGKKAAPATAGQKQPGSLLEKPRVGLPEAE